jgi:excisionase family DNA binding protein
MYLQVELIHALQPSERRCYNRKEAASYVGVSVGTFDKLVQQGVMPSPIELFGRKVWDRTALDAVLDTLSGRFPVRAAAALVPSEDAMIHDQLDRELQEFRVRHGYA